MHVFARNRFFSDQLRETLLEVCTTKEKKRFDRSLVVKKISLRRDGTLLHIQGVNFFSSSSGRDPSFINISFRYCRDRDRISLPPVVVRGPSVFFFKSCVASSWPLSFLWEPISYSTVVYHHEDRCLRRNLWDTGGMIKVIRIFSYSHAQTIRFVIRQIVLFSFRTHSEGRDIPRYDDGMDQHNVMCALSCVCVCSACP